MYIYIYIYMELCGYIQTLKSLNQSAEEENSLAMPPAVAITQDTGPESGRNSIGVVWI